MLKVNEGADLQNQKIINVQDPTNPQEVATKNYVDGAVTSASRFVETWKWGTD